MMRALRRIVLWGVPALLLLAVGAALWAHGAMSRPHRGWDGESVEIVVEPGVDAGTVLQRLHDAGVIRHPGLVKLWLRWNGGSGSLHAGEYRFDEAASALQVLERLRNGDVLLHPVTLPEGLDLAETAHRLEAAGFGPAQRYLEIFRAPRLIADLDPEANDLEGYLFPDTYRFPGSVEPERVAEALVRRFREVGDGDFRAKAEAVGLTLRQAVTLASLVEKETSLAEERERISRVFHNRLERGMLLQCDPTVIYALKRDGITVERLTYGHLAFESPWNTYTSPGLPPGPIASPGAASLAAAVEPADGDELYFVAAPGGGHRFSRDLKSHQQAVREWRAYSRSSR